MLNFVEKAFIIIGGGLGGLLLLYIVVRVSAAAWFKTKTDFSRMLMKGKRNE